MMTFDPIESLDEAEWDRLFAVNLRAPFSLVRRALPHNLFVYILGRAFLGTAACLFATGALAQWTGHALNVAVEPELALVARWLMAWGDAFLTGMFGAIFVAFVPQWLATWSDQRYLQPPQS